MIDGLRPYAAYRASPDRWLTQFPSTWEKVRIKYLLREIDRRTQTGEEPLLSMRRDHGLVPLSQFSDKVAEPKALLAYKLVRPGELVVNRMQAGNGLVFVARIPGLISPDYAIFRPVREVNLDYLELLFRSYPMRAKFRSESTGLGTGTAGFLRLYGDSLGAIEIGLPSEDEQAQIVRFLGYADRQIRNYIGAKKKVIALLNEQKQVIIHTAITRGLDPNVRLKPSGVDWLGQVPEHWQIMRLHQLVDPDRPIMYGIVLPGPDVDEGVYIVKGGNCEPGRLIPERLSRTTFDIESHYARSRLISRDIVFAIRGGVGASEMVPASLAGANVTQDAARIAAGPGIQPEWLLYAVRAPVFLEHVRSQVVGATVRGINIRDLKRIEMPVPPFKEQREIVDHLQIVTKHVVDTLLRAHQEVALLLEYRTRLAAEVVTGKLDAREAAAHLLDASTPSEDEGLLAEAAAESDAADLDDAEAEVIA